MQDVPSGTVVEEATTAFPSLESMLWHPWKLLSQKWTHKLVYVLRGSTVLLVFPFSQKCSPLPYIYYPKALTSHSAP